MEKDLIFFGESGLTSTSANFICNLCKENYMQIEQSLNGMQFYTTKVKLLGSSDQSVLKEGTMSIASVESNMKQIAQLKSLIAWLREAIKAKDRLIKEAQTAGFDYFNMQVPDAPEIEDYITADDVVATFNVKQRNRYYYLEAYCSTIGGYIHPDGAFAKQREDLQNVIQEPNRVSGNGRDTIIYSYSPTIPVSQVEDTFMSLQQTYREYQAELNSIKHDIEDRVIKDTAKKDIEYKEKLDAYRTEKKALDAELAVRKNEAVTAASNLKIIIPDSLKDTFEKIKNLGKD